MAERERHYIITLQRAGSDFRISTTQGQYFGDDPEYAAFHKTWEGACADNSRADGLPWTTKNTAVLFYRLMEIE